MFVECLSTNVVTSNIFLKDEWIIGYWIVLLVTRVYKRAEFLTILQ